jgi:hypothetical protein
MRIPGTCDAVPPPWLALGENRQVACHHSAKDLAAAG